MILQIVVAKTYQEIILFEVDREVEMEVDM